MSTYVNGTIVAMGYEPGTVRKKSEYTKAAIKGNPSNGTNVFFMTREELDKHLKELK